MYVNRLQLANYGPIDKLNITFPFNGDIPKPVILVGENGSGKSICLSHIVNGLIAAKTIAYPQAREVEMGKVYKLRSQLYIASASDYYFSRVDFDDELFMAELVLRQQKQEYQDEPIEIANSDARPLWSAMRSDMYNHLMSNISINSEKQIKSSFANNCVLYFPANRFEEPAWLNEANLKARARYMTVSRMEGNTDRQVIDYASLRDNQNWLLDVIYDSLAFDVHIERHRTADSQSTIPVPVIDHSGGATRRYKTARQVVRAVTRRSDAILAVGERHNKAISIQSRVGPSIPNIFQLSSGETCLLNLFLSILRDFDLTGTSVASVAEIRGIVIVDEIDLHLHAVHQYEVLPELIKMFPHVQFVVTTHSPLFVLGMNEALGRDGFVTYQLPYGRQIRAEEFDEFQHAYRAFTLTGKYSADIQTAIESARQPIVIAEGITDKKYIETAARLLGKGALLAGVELHDGGGSGNLRNIWRRFTQPLSDIVPQKMLLLFDCDEEERNERRENLVRCNIPRQEDNPIENGIENLFGQFTIDKACKQRPAFIDITDEHKARVRGEAATVLRQLTVNKNEKTNLCDWLCEHGTKEDFLGFHVIFRILEEFLGAAAVLGEEANPDGSGKPDPISG